MEKSLYKYFHFYTNIHKNPGTTKTSVIDIAAAKLALNRARMKLPCACTIVEVPAKVDKK